MVKLKDYSTWLEKMFLKKYCKLEQLKFELDNSFIQRLKFLFSKEFRNKLFSKELENKDSFSFIEKDEDIIHEDKYDIYENIISGYKFNYDETKDKLILTKKSTLRKGFLDIF